MQGTRTSRLPGQRSASRRAAAAVALFAATGWFGCGVAEAHGHHRARHHHTHSAKRRALAHKADVEAVEELAFLTPEEALAAGALCGSEDISWVCTPAELVEYTESEES